MKMFFPRSHEMRVFLDTPVIVSAAAVRGLCADVLREVLAYHELIMSIPVIAELNTILFTQLNLPDDIITESIGFLYHDAHVSERFSQIDININDKEDIIILESFMSYISHILRSRIPKARVGKMMEVRLIAQKIALRPL